MANGNSRINGWLAAWWPVIATTLLLSISGLQGYAALQTRIAILENDLRRDEAIINELKIAQEKHLERALNNLETRMDSRFEHLGATIESLSTEVHRLRNRLE